MMTFIGFTAAVIFFLASAQHFYWAVVNKSKGVSAALPSVDNRVIFRPSRIATLAVAIALSICGLLILGKLGCLGSVFPSNFYVITLNLLAATLILRAIGDFRMMGIFKKIKDTSFARMDTKIYIPLCATLGGCCFIVASGTTI